ncbi:MAG: peptidylprolyl isomerase [Eubacterium sp.]|nr:peptidylprolyl isomerase [Eubacterium sp.]
MAKKSMEDDILTGGSLGSGKEKSSKKENKKSAGGIKIAKRTATIIKSAVCIVIVIALLAAYVATGTVRKGFIASLSLPAQTLTGVTVSNGDQKAKVKVSTYNFYYASTYNSLKSQKEQYEQYGLDMSQLGLDVDFSEKLSKQTYTDTETNKEMTWAEHLDEMVLDAIESTYTYYLAAVEANGGEEPEITQDQKDQLEETIKSYTETANQYGYTLSGYLVRAMGKGVTEKVFRTESIRQYIASNYKTELTTDVESKEYTADDVNKYKDEHTDDLLAVDIKLFEADSEDNAKAFKDELKADGSNFAELAAKYSTDDFNKKAYTEDGFTTELGVTKAILQSKQVAIATADPHEHEEGEEHSDDEEQTYSGLDWLFSADRKAGDIYQHSTSIVYVITPAAITNTEAVNVRHILIAPETTDDAAVTDATDEQWKAAYSKAEEILNNWKSGDATEDSFAELAKENTTDTGSQDNGGLYENVIPGQMVNPFSAWCFEAGRKAGDTAIVRTAYGYHIMYYVGTTGEKVWEYNAKQALASADGASQSEKLEEEYTLKVNWFGSRYFEKDVDIDN